jgi:nucleoside-diphosphate-sugar epimerase
MRLLLIGGTAFIGPRVVRRLAAAGHDVAVFHRGKTPAILPAGTAEFFGDRRRLDDHASTLRAWKTDVVVDMMLLTEADARALMSVFSGHARRVVAVSSIDATKAYGVLHRTEPGPPVRVPFDENTPVRNALYPYRGKFPGLDDYDKIPVERECLAHPALPACVLRLPMVYGPGDRQRRLRAYVRRFDAGRPALLLPAGLARWRGSRGYVENVAAAIALAALDPRADGRTYHVAEEPALEERAWAAAVAKACGWKGRIVEAPEASLPEGMCPGFETAQDLWADSGRIRRELGYREEVGFEEGLMQTVAWEREHPPEKGGEEGWEEEERVLRGMGEAGWGTSEQVDGED